MGVMTCGRDGCRNILCDRTITHSDYSSSYICDECWEELMNFKDTLTPPMTERDVREAIDGFMDTEKGKHSKPDHCDIDEVFRCVSSDRRDRSW